MPDSSGQRAEKPTKQRLEKAHREGNFPSSREFVAGIQFLGFVVLTVTYSGAWLTNTARATRTLLARAFTVEVTPDGLIALMWTSILPQFKPLLEAGGVLVLIVLFAQLATTRLGISLTKLVPDLNRLNFLKRFSSVPAQNVPLFLQALLLLPLIGYAVYYEVRENLGSILELPWMSARAAAARIGGTLEVLLWRSAALFMLVGIGDLIWQNRRYTKQLMMSKQEVREESKEQQGDPHIKMRIRRMQRDLARRQMMKEVPTATAVIVNPTHYAVAIRYSMDSTAAPMVVAKGKNYVAARIRKLAVEHRVPIVENPPLAQALYASVAVGQEIPSHLYRAVAEILAYIYRMTNGHLRG
jgi:flagellar biosynthetic protein FlhB